jgi:hypothetical protein
VVRNRNQFLKNSEIDASHKQQTSKLHLPSVNITKYQKEEFYLGIKVFNALLCYIKTEFDNPMRFRRVLQTFLHENSFCSLNEYFEFKKSQI